MRKYILIVGLLLIAGVAQAQWTYESLSGVQPKVRTSIEELRIYSTLPKIKGTWYFVDPDNGSSGASGRSIDRAVDEIENAYSKVTSGNGDGIVLLSGGTTSGETTSYLTDEITWSKHAVTVYGVAAPVGMFGRARIADSSGVDSLAYLIKVTGDNNTFINVSFWNSPDDSLGGADVAAHTTIYVSGNRNAFINCFMACNPDKSTTSKSDLTLEGQENYFYHCTFGTDTWDVGNIASANILLDASGARNHFEDCETVSHSSTGTSMGAVKSADASSISRNLVFKNCVFQVFRENGAVANNASWFIGTAPTSGLIIVHNSIIVGYAAWDATGGNDRVYVGSAASAASGGGGIPTTP